MSTLSFINHLCGNPILKNINNGTLLPIHAMPQKNLTSDNENNFAMNRFRYFQTYAPRNATYFKELKEKKWIGGNRDSSSLVANRKADAISETLNANNKPISFTTVLDNNTQRQAIERVHRGSTGVPAKNRFKNMKTTPVFYV